MSPNGRARRGTPAPPAHEGDRLWRGPALLSHQRGGGSCAGA